MKISTLLVIMFSLFLLGACNYNIDNQDKNAADGIEEKDLAQPSYPVVAAKIIKPKCLECHSVSGGNRGGVNLESYPTVRRALNQTKAAIEDGSMPKNRTGLTSNQKKLFLKWIDMGAPELSNQAPVPSPEAADEIPLNYASVNTIVIESACITCHSAQRIEGKVRLDNYADVAKNAAKIAKSVADGAMPKRGQISEKQKALILSWISEGAPEQSTKVFTTGGLVPDKAPSGNGDAGGSPLSLDREFLARGEYLFNLSSCSNCHTVDPAQPLAGGKTLDTPFGQFNVPNISAAPITGIGKWSAKDFLRALREGISPKGKLYFPAFPFTNFSKMTDEDILSIQAYIMSLPATEHPNQPHKLRFPFNQRWLLSFWRIFNFPVVNDQNAQSFLVARGPYQDVTEKNLAWNRGAYLVEGPMHCTQCHTPRGELGGLLTDKWLAGSKVSGDSLPAPNLTPDRETGLGTWTQATWMQFLVNGVTPSGDKVGGEMWKVIKDATSKLTDSDRLAVTEYLQSLPPVKNNVVMVHSAQ